MPNDSREARADTLQLLLPWGAPQLECDDGPGAAFWLASGASLLLWTAVALLLTSV